MGSREEKLAAWKRRVEDIRNTVKLSSVVGKWTKLERAGGELVGLCIVHREKTPSMRVNDGKGVAFCFGCGWSGDVFDVVMEQRGLDFKGAVDFLDGGGFETLTPQEREAIDREETERDLAAIREAADCWKAGRPIAGTAGETYLRGRGLTLELPPSLRFGFWPAWKNKETGNPGPPMPCVIGAVSDLERRLIGVQRIYVEPNGAGKASRLKKAKLSLGRPRTGALKYGPPAKEIVLCEGPEDGLALAQEMEGVSVWVGLGTAMLPSIDLPPVCESVIIAADNNPAGRAAAEKATLEISSAGRLARTMFPDEGFDDFNDQLLGKRK